MLALSPLERNCSGTEKLLNSCFAEQLTRSPVCLNKQDDSETKSKSTMSDRHRMQLVGIQMYCSGPRRVDDINYRHTSFLPQTYSIELTNITSVRNRTKKILLSILMLSAQEQYYTRRKDCHTSFQSKTYNADHEQTVIEMDRQTLSEKIILTYRQELQRAQSPTKGQICILVCSGLRHFRTEDIEDISLFTYTGYQNFTSSAKSSLADIGRCYTIPKMYYAYMGYQNVSSSGISSLADTERCYTIPEIYYTYMGYQNVTSLAKSSLVDTGRCYMYTKPEMNYAYTGYQNVKSLAKSSLVDMVDTGRCYTTAKSSLMDTGRCYTQPEINYAYTGHQNVTSAYNPGRCLIGHSAHNYQGSSSWGCTLL